MDEPKSRCRYLRLDGNRCTREVMFEGSILLCQKHLWEANLMFLEAGRALATQVQETRGEGPDIAPERPPFTPRTFNGLVYYIRFGDRIKIGTTTDLEGRLKVIPHDELLATEDGGRQVEAARHRQFHHCRIQGEWFHADDPALLAHIASLDAPATV